MKKPLTRLLVATLAAIVFILPTAAFAGKNSNNAKTSTAKVQDDVTEGEVANATSALTRTSQSVAVHIHTTELAPDSVYTVWWIIFNKPKHCSGGVCGSKDFGNAKVKASGIRADGRVTDAWGQVDFSSDLNVGELPDVPPNNVLFGPGLLDKNAEIHFPILGHGRADELEAAGLLDAALTTPNGGCGFEEPGDVGTGTCPTEQFVIFLP